MALAMALACLANSNHSVTSAVGAPSDHYNRPTAARWQSFVMTDLADRRQRRAAYHPPASRANRFTEASPASIAVQGNVLWRRGQRDQHREITMAPCSGSKAAIVLRPAVREPRPAKKKPLQG